VQEQHLDRGLVLVSRISSATAKLLRFQERIASLKKRSKKLLILCLRLFGRTKRAATPTASGLGVLAVVAAAELVPPPVNREARHHRLGGLRSGLCTGPGWLAA
jgi:hypothetical protein